MAMISDKDRDYIKKAFEEIPSGKVTAVVFTEGLDGAGAKGAGGASGPAGDESAASQDCEYCAEMKGLFEELATISDKMTAQFYDLHSDAEKAKEYGVDRAPAAIILDPEGKDRGVRFYGFPGGYEFASLIAGITDVGKGEGKLSAETKAALKTITSPVKINVFVTPT